MKTIFSSLVVLFLILIENHAVAQNDCDKTCNAIDSPDRSTCCSVGIGSSPCITFGSDPACPSYAISYSWAPSGSLSNSAICNPTASPTVTTTYTLTITFTCGADASSSCCCDGCFGSVCTDEDANECYGTTQRVDYVTVTYTGPNCCRLINPENLPELVSPTINVYPSPSSNGILNVTFTEPSPSNSIHIYDITG